MNFIIDLSVLTTWKGESYNSILVIVNCLTKIVHYEPVKVTINISSLAKVIINVIIHYYKISESIVTDHDLLFTLMFWSSLHYFLGIKKSYLLFFTLKQIVKPINRIA